MRPKRRVSPGTIAMIVFSCLVLAATYFVMSGIRKDEGDLSMDAEVLLGSVGELFAITQRHIDEGVQTLPARTAVPGHTKAPIASHTPVPSAQQQTIIPSVSIQPTSAPNPNKTFTMTFSGSIMLESSVVSGAYDKKEKAYRYNTILEGIAPAVHADVNFAIVETLFSSSSISNKDLVAPIDSLSAISVTGFDTAILCGQDALSGGEDCARETLAAFHASGMRTSGLFLPEASRRFDIMQINGVKVALLTYTDGVSSAGKKLVSDVKTREAMLHLFNADSVRADISTARKQGAQVIVVFLHTETNDAADPGAIQKKNAQLLADAGADILIGFGGRNVQHVEMLTSSSNPSHRMLTAWSLGTLVCEDRDTRGVVSGVLLHVQMTHDSSSGKLKIDKIEYTPTYCWRQEESGIYPFRVIRSNQRVPEGMIQKQREIIARSLVLIQNTMEKGIAVQR